MKKSTKHTILNIRKKFIFLGLAIISIIVIVILMGPLSNHQPENNLQNKINSKNDSAGGIHLETGLKEDHGLETVITHCTACHSAQLITQNRMSREKWNATIRWMQETQNLWDLGENQEVIVNYLVKNYPIEHVGRRKNLQNIEWYTLNE